MIGQVYSKAIPLFVERWNPLSLSRVFERVCKAVSLFEDASATLRSSSGRQICEVFFRENKCDRQQHRSVQRLSCVFLNS